MRLASAFMALVLLGVTVVVHGATRKIDFSDDTVGHAPKGFEFGHTARAGAPGQWIVQSEGSNKYLAQVDADHTRSRFPVAVVSDVNAADVDLSVRFKPVSGRVDQAAGLVWRFQNEDNYSTPELEFETNLIWLPSGHTRGWVSSHFDIVDKLSAAERPTDRRAYTHKLNFELDTSFGVFNWLPEDRWLRGVELEASVDYVATGVPKAGDLVNGVRFVDNASPWSFSLVIVLPIAPL